MNGTDYHFPDEAGQALGELIGATTDYRTREILAKLTTADLDRIEGYAYDLQGLAQEERDHRAALPPRPDGPVILLDTATNMREVWDRQDFDCFSFGDQYKTWAELYRYAQQTGREIYQARECRVFECGDRVA